MVAHDPDLKEDLVLQRITGQPRLCADPPEMAAELPGCEIDRIGAAMLRAAAAIIGAAGKSEPDTPVESLTVHEARCGVPCANRCPAREKRA